MIVERQTGGQVAFFKVSHEYEIHFALISCYKENSNMIQPALFSHKCRHGDSLGHALAAGYTFFFVRYDPTSQW